MEGGPNRGFTVSHYSILRTLKCRHHFPHTTAVEDLNSKQKVGFATEQVILSLTRDHVKPLRTNLNFGPN